MTPPRVSQVEQLGMKKEIRRSVRVSRDNIAPDQRRLKSSAVAARALPKLGGANIVAAYCPMRSELDPIGIIAALRAKGCLIAYPRMVRHTRVLEFALVGAGDELDEGPFKVFEPKLEATLISLDSIDTFLVPGLSFDATGNRLGYGRGYYDYTLAQNLRALRVGLCFQEQIATSIPRSATDQQMDWVVTETESFAGPERNRAIDPKVPS